MTVTIRCYVPTDRAVPALKQVTVLQSLRFGASDVETDLFVVTNDLRSEIV